MQLPIPQNGQEIILRDDDFIVSKTDIEGRILYGNQIFIEFSGYTEKELLGSPHNLVRHPDMPRGVFKLLWETIATGNECFAYVKNQSKDGRFYWVFANITPDFGPDGKILGYFSARRKPKAESIRLIEPIYRSMVAIENRSEKGNAPQASLEHLHEMLDKRGVSYDQFVLEI